MFRQGKCIVSHRRSTTATVSFELAVAKKDRATREKANALIKRIDGFGTIAQPVIGVAVTAGRAADSALRGQDVLKLSKDFEDSAKSYGLVSSVVLSILAAIIVSVKNLLSRNKLTKEKEYKEMRRRANAWYERFRAFYRLGTDVGQLAGYVIPTHLRIVRGLFSTVTGFLTGMIGVFAFDSWSDLTPCALWSGEFDDEAQFLEAQKLFALENRDYAYVHVKVGERTRLYYVTRDDTPAHFTWRAVLDSENLDHIEKLQKITTKFNLGASQTFNTFSQKLDKLTDQELGYLAHHIENEEGHHRIESSIYKLGKKDGWSRYTKTGASIGASLGASIFGLIGLFVPLPPPLNALIFSGIGAAVGGIIGFVAPAAIVPLANMISPTHDTSYRSNYAKVGSVYGGSIGAIIGFIIGLIIPVPGFAALGTTIGTGIGALIGSIVFAVAGPSISRRLGDNHSSSWDYGLKSASAPGYYSGLAVGNVLEHHSIGDGHDVKQLCGSIGNLVTGVAGGVYDAYKTYRNKDLNPEELTPKIPLLPWSQRLGTCSTLFCAVGAVMGFCIGGPLGMAIGTGVGAFLAPIVAASYGQELCLGLMKVVDSITHGIERFFKLTPAKGKTHHQSRHKKHQWNKSTLACREAGLDMNRLGDPSGDENTLSLSQSTNSTSSLSPPPSLSSSAASSIPDVPVLAPRYEPVYS